MFHMAGYRRLITEQSEEDFESLPVKATARTPIRRSSFDLINKLTFTFLITVITISWLLWIIFFPKTSVQKRLTAAMVTVTNGTYCGIYDETYDQFQFLGIPYASPPIDHLRFRPPKSLDEAWEGVRNATKYGPACIGYRGHNLLYPRASEDCLTINIVSPRSHSAKDYIPVAAFIYGGNHQGGGSIDQRYNMSYLTSHASSHGMPFIAVSFNYRSSIWGFIAGEEARGTGNLNLGLKDQRLALHWIQENIKAFGGDPRRVTLMGGSSGAQDVGLHLSAYGGRDDGLFRAAILQSGSMVTSLGLKYLPTQSSYERLILATGCVNSDDSLECLRHLSFNELNSVFDINNNSQDISTDMRSQSLPVIDGDFVQSYGSLSLKESKFVKVPIIIGVASNEGYNLLPDDLSSWNMLFQLLLDSPWKFPLHVVEKLLSFYPDPDATETLVPPIKGISDLGTYNRIEEVLGDLVFYAAKRLQCGAYSQFTTCYSYRFDAIETLSSGNIHEGVRHSAEIAPVFQNFDGQGYPEDKNPFAERQPGYFEMSKAVGLMWAGFITQLDPNFAFAEEVWPKYNLENPQNIVFNETGPYWTEEDVVRIEATSYINSIQHGILYQ